MPPVELTMGSGLGRVVLSSPETGNALDEALVTGLLEALGRAAEDPGCRVIVLSSSGPEFCRGLALEEMVPGRGHAPQALLRSYLDCLRRISIARVPVVAVVEGTACGGGVGLAGACDLVMAGAGATFMLSETLVGMIPALITPFLLRRMSLARLKYLALSSRKLSAEEAFGYGLVDELVASDMPAALAEQLRRMLYAYAPALEETKRLLNRFEADLLQDRSQVSLGEIGRWLERDEVRAGIEDFTQGFSPAWFAGNRLSEGR